MVEIDAVEARESGHTLDGEGSLLVGVPAAFLARLDIEPATECTIRQSSVLTPLDGRLVFYDDL